MSENKVTQDFKEAVIKAISEEVNLYSDDISGETKLKDIPLDSLTHICVIIRLEMDQNILIDDTFSYHKGNTIDEYSQLLYDAILG